MTHRPALSTVLVAAILPLAIAAIGIGTLLAVSPQLPDPIAVHWNLDGPDGFASPLAYLVIYALLAVGFTVLFGVLAFTGSKRGPTWVHKMLAATSLGIAVLMFVIFVGGAVMQRGLEDAAAAPNVGWLVFAGLGSALAAGAIGWFVQPRTVPVHNDFAEAKPLPLAPEERAVWLARTHAPLGVFVTILVALTIVIGFSVYVTVQSSAAAWWLLLVPVVLTALALFTTSWRVRVDERGLEVRSVLGRPVFTVATADVARVGAAEIAPGADFGGWGLRFAPGRRVGVVTRSGIAIDVQRRDGSSLAVTVDDAETGAALLAAYAAAAAPSA